MPTLALAAVFALSGVHTCWVSTCSRPPDHAHPVVVQSDRTGAMRVYDCRSPPDGKAWRPTCVRADMRDEAPGGN